MPRPQFSSFVRLWALLAMCHPESTLGTVSGFSRAPRLRDSPFPVSRQPERITTLDLTGASWHLRVLALSAAGVVAQRCPELAVVDAQKGEAPDGSEGGISLWHLRLLPITLDRSLESDIVGVLRRFRGDIKGYVMCDVPGSTASVAAGSETTTTSAHVAVSLAGVLKAVVVTPETEHLAEQAGLAPLGDARRMSPSVVFHNHQSSFSETLLLNQRLDKLVYTIDLAVYSRAFTLFDAKLDSGLSQSALARMRPVSMVLGWGDEYEMVSSASRHGHQVLCSDFGVNLPVYMNFAPPATEPGQARSAASPPACPKRAPEGAPDTHTVAFMFTDGDSISWTLGDFASPDFDWWACPARGAVPISWTLQPMLQELHPYFLAWISRTRNPADELLVGPSGAGYAYLDLYPSRDARQRFARWTADVMAGSRGLMLNMVNQIQAGVYSAAVEAEGLDASRPPDAVFVDEHDRLSILGDASLLPGLHGTVVTSRRHVLSKVFGDVTPEDLVQRLNGPGVSRNYSSMHGYSLIGVEVWGYGVTDIADIVGRLNSSAVRVVSLGEYIACLRETAELKQQRVDQLAALQSTWTAGAKGSPLASALTDE